MQIQPATIVRLQSEDFDTQHPTLLSRPAYIDLLLRQDAIAVLTDDLFNGACFDVVVFVDGALINTRVRLQHIYRTDVVLFCPHDEPAYIPPPNRINGVPDTGAAEQFALTKGKDPLFALDLATLHRLKLQLKNID